MLQARFKPIEQWPRAFTKASARKRSPFRANYNNTLSQVEQEVRHLRGRNVVIQLALQPRDIRLDGWPRADARSPQHPGVLLSFDAWIPPQGLTTLSFCCDNFTDWESNLRAIALTMERLRMVDAYDVVKFGEQYTGFMPEKAAAFPKELLPAPPAPSPPAIAPEPVWRPDPAANIVPVLDNLPAEMEETS